MSTPSVSRFQKVIYSHYRRHKRDLPWRKTRNPYNILVSEIMLQQTQVERVRSKYKDFLQKFPDFTFLAQARLAEILKVWQGLGYNRRAKSLKKIAEMVVHTYKGKLPESTEILQALPGIGRATASAISAFAFDRPAVFIETNIRRVFIHFFFPGKENVRDSQIFPFVEKTLDPSNPRQWYYALMDYGVMLKKKYPDLLKKSAHYKRQTPFEGSDRQIRGALLRRLTERRYFSESEIARGCKMDLKRVRKILVDLQMEGFIKRSGKQIALT